MKTLTKILFCVAFICLMKIQASAQCTSTSPSGSSCGSPVQLGVLESENSGNYPCSSPTNINPDDYNCHQFVRAALEKGWVNLYCGNPTQAPCSRTTKFSTLSNSNINIDPKYVKLCGAQYAQAISFDSSDHSVLVLGSGAYASKQGPGGDLLYQTNPTWGAGSCPYSYYAYMGNVSMSGAVTTLVSGSTRTFTLSQQPAYITSITWTVDTRFLEIQSGQGTLSLTVKAKCGAGFSGLKAAYVTAAMATACDTTPPTFTKNFNVDCGINPCEGTINGAYLNTVNGVTANNSNTVALNGAGPYTWTKTSGTTNYWYTGSNGKYLYFSIPSGATANFNVTGMGCNRTIGFATGYGYRIMTSNEETDNSLTVESKAKVKFRIIDFVSGKTIHEGVVAAEDESKPLEVCGPGFYILEVNGKRKKVLKQ